MIGSGRLGFGEKDGTGIIGEVSQSDLLAVAVGSNVEGRVGRGRVAQAKHVMGDHGWLGRDRKEVPCISSRAGAVAAYFVHAVQAVALLPTIGVLVGTGGADRAIQIITIKGVRLALGLKVLL